MPIQIYWKFHHHTWKFSDKNFDIFHISVQNIDCGYLLELPHWGSTFLCRNKKNNVYPCKPQFYYIKVGFKGVKIIKVCFRDDISFAVCMYPEDTFSYGMAPLTDLKLFRIANSDQTEAECNVWLGLPLVANSLAFFRSPEPKAHGELLWSLTVRRRRRRPDVRLSTIFKQHLLLNH